VSGGPTALGVVRNLSQLAVLDNFSLARASICESGTNKLRAMMMIGYACSRVAAVRFANRRPSAPSIGKECLLEDSDAADQDGQGVHVHGAAQQSAAIGFLDRFSRCRRCVLHKTHGAVTLHGNWLLFAVQPIEYHAVLSNSIGVRVGLGDKGGKCLDGLPRDVHPHEAQGLRVPSHFDSVTGLQNVLHSLARGPTLDFLVGHLLHARGAQGLTKLVHQGRLQWA
jgi:hypothetical protein